MGFDFDVTKTEQIFDMLLREKHLQLSPGHKILSAEVLQGRKYCKFHNTFDSHNTVDCRILRQQIQNIIEQGRITHARPMIEVDNNLFPNVSMLSIGSSSFNSPFMQDTPTNFCQRIQKAIECGSVITRPALADDGQIVLPSINMVEVTSSSKGKAKADQSEDRPCVFDPKKHTSEKEV